MSEILKILVEKVPYTLWILASLPIGFLYILLLVPLSLLSFHAVMIPLSMVLRVVLHVPVSSMLPAFTFFEYLDPVIVSSIRKLDALGLLVAWNYVLFRACTKGWERIIAIFFVSYTFTLLNFFLVRRVTTKATSCIRRLLRRLRGLKEGRCEEEEADVEEKLRKEIEFKMWLYRVVEAHMIRKSAAFSLATVTNLYVVSSISFILILPVWLLSMVIFWGREEMIISLSNSIILMLFIVSWRILRGWKNSLKKRLDKLEGTLQECFKAILE